MNELLVCALFVALSTLQIQASRPGASSAVHGRHTPVHKTEPKLHNHCKSERAGNMALK